ncbi:MAG TPA: S1 RNA-binding domain-containing protein [Ignisphaera sp.]|nr:S1 RNA-binding domain-containing protein [Ignisphaera sp.]
MSLVFKRKDLPEVGELVIAKIKKVFEYGAYVDLEEFENLEAFIPWSKLAHDM